MHRNWCEIMSVCSMYMLLLLNIRVGFHFGMWRAKGGIILRNGDQNEPVTKWKDIDLKFQLRPVYIEELEDEGQRYDFYSSKRAFEGQ